MYSGHGSREDVPAVTIIMYAVSERTVGTCRCCYSATASLLKCAYDALTGLFYDLAVARQARLALPVAVALSPDFRRSFNETFS